MNGFPSPPTEISVEQLKSDWEQLHPLDRAMAISRLKKSGTSTRKIAKQLGRSESTLRHLLLILKAPASDLLSARQENPSINELVRRGKAESERREGLHKANLERERKEQALAGSKLIYDWLQKHQFGGPSGKQIVEEARSIIIENHFAGTLPNVDPPDYPVAPATIIERCKPKEPLNDTNTDIGWYGKWLARWAPYVFTDPEVRDEAIEMALEQQWKR